MSYLGLQIQSLSFHGPQKEPAVVRFQGGLNVVYGASDTGKSFIVEAIDFMFGAKGPLKDIPQAVGYDQILLVIQLSEIDTITARRSMDGGAFEIFEGAFSDELPGIEGKVLSEVHSSKDKENLSAFLLGRVDELPHVYFAGFAPRKFDGSTLIFDSMEDLDVDEDERTRLGTCIGSISGLPPVCWCEGKE